MEELEFAYIDFVILSFDEKESEENIDCVWSQLHDQKVHFKIYFFNGHFS